MQPIVSGCSVVPDSTGLRGIRPTGLSAFPSTPRAVHERLDQRCTSVGTVGPNRHGHGYMTGLRAREVASRSLAFVIVLGRDRRQRRDRRLGVRLPVDHSLTASTAAPSSKKHRAP